MSINYALYHHPVTLIVNYLGGGLTWVYPIFLNFTLVITFITVLLRPVAKKVSTYSGV